MSTGANFTYIAINLLIIAGPLALSWVPTLHYYRTFWKVLVAALPVAIVFIVWDIWFTGVGVWSFAPELTLPTKFFGLPIGEVLFFFTVPFSCIFIYISTRYHLPESKLAESPLKLIKLPNIPVKSRSVVSLVAILLFTIAGLVAGELLYTRVVLFSCAVVLFANHVISTGLRRRPTKAELNYSGLFRDPYYYIFMGFSVIGFLLINSILTGIPVVSYDPAFNIGIRIGTIPLEDFFYNFALLSGYLLSYKFFFSTNTSGD